MNITKITTDLANGIFWKQEALSSPPERLDDCHLVCLYPELTDQTFEGFGGAFTESAGLCWKKLSPEKRSEFLEAYWGKDGLGYVLGRTHMNSCDFSVDNYTAANPEDGVRDFSRDDAAILPLLQAAQRTAGQPIGMLLSPWSPPAWMKTNGEMNHGGKLKEEYAAAYAALLADYAAHYRTAGFDVRWMSIQNEPEAVQTWDSCVFTAEEEGRFAAEALRPALDAAGLEDVELLIWDHNKESLLRRIRGTLSVPGVAEAVSGTALHWYTGDHFEAVALAHRAYPENKLYFTEGCVKYGDYQNMYHFDSELLKAENYAHDIIGNLNAGVAGSLDWNLLLDEQGGPNHVGNFCDAPVMLDGTGSFEKKGTYYYIGHLSRYIRPGAVRVETSRYCAEIEVTAFRNLDGSLSVVLLNRSARRCPACLAQDGEKPLAWLWMEPHTITTLVCV